MALTPTEFTAGERRYALVAQWPQLSAQLMWSDVCAVSIGAGDSVHVLCRGPQPLMVFTPEGVLVQEPDCSRFQAPHGSYVLPDGTWLITDEGTHALIAINGDGVETLRVAGDGPSLTGYQRSADIHASIDSVKKAAGPFNRPTGVAVADNGDIFVCDGYGNARVHRFSADGDLLSSFGEPGTGPGQFRLPHGIHIDSQQRLWVADWGNARLQCFSLDGVLERIIEGFDGPAGITSDADGVMIVAEEEWRISVLDADGGLLARWHTLDLEEASRVFVAPHSVAVDSAGSVYVGEVAHAYRGINRGPRALQKLRRIA